MSREINSVKDAELKDSVDKPSDFKERMVKLIPSEIITAYVTIYGLVSAVEPEEKSKLLWAVILILLFLTPIYLIKVSNVTKWQQLLFSTLGFLIWVFATGSPEENIYCYPTAFIASLVLIIYTLFIPILYKG